MEYICVKRFKRLGQSGERFNIPYGTVVQERGGVLYHDDKAVCNDHSAVMRGYFARNDDGAGLVRGKLTRSIQARLDLPPGEARDKLWGKVWEDETCLHYRKQAQADYFIWDISFYNAPINDLVYIAALVGAGKGA